MYSLTSVKAAMTKIAVIKASRGGTYQNKAVDMNRKAISSPIL